MRCSKYTVVAIAFLVISTIIAFGFLIERCVRSYRHKIWTSQYLPRSKQVFPTAAVCNGIDQGKPPTPLNSTNIKNIPRIHNWCYTFTYDYSMHKNIRLNCKTQPVFVVWESKLNCTVVNLYSRSDLAAYTENLFDKQHETTMYMWFQYESSRFDTFQVYFFHGTQDVTLINKLQEKSWQKIGADLKFNPSRKVESLSLSRKLYTTFMYVVRTREWKPYSSENHEKDFMLKQQANFKTNITEGIFQIGVVIGDSNVLLMQETPEVNWLSTIMLMGGALGIATNVYRFVLQPLGRCPGKLRKYNNLEREEILNEDSEMSRKFEELQNQIYVYTNLSIRQQLVEANQINKDASNVV